MALSLFLTIFSFAALTLNFASEGASVPAIFVFGDSLADVGNNNYVNTSKANKADFPPNGIDLPSKTPTGRFSNGYNFVDWLAKFVGFEQSPPAFLSLTKRSDILHGVNFASGASGILDTTGTAIPFTAQIANFKSIADALKEQIGGENATRLLSKSLFIISVGSNDMFGFVNAGPKNATQNEQFVAALATKFGDHLEELHKHGARKFGVLGTSLCGCIPVMRALNSTGGCVEVLNDLSRIFNTAAKRKMCDLKSKLEGMKYSYANVYDMMDPSGSKPQLSGFTDNINACCGSGKFNGEDLCTSNATLCSNRNQYVFWDHYHPTQVVSMYTAQSFYSGSRRFASPVNIRILAKS